MRGVLMASILCGFVYAETEEDSGILSNVRFEERVDEQHDRTSRWLVRQLDRMNSWLLDTVGDEDERESEFFRHYYGDRTSPYDVAGSHIRLSPVLGWSDSRGFDPGIRFSARVRLSRISERLRFYAESFDLDEDDVENIFSDRYREPVESTRSQSASAGLTYLLQEHTRTQASVSGGMRFRPQPVPQARLRGRVYTEAGEWTPAFIQTVFWDGRDGFGERSEIDLPRRVGDRHVFRSNTSAEWSETTRGVEFGQVLSWTTKLTEERTLRTLAAARMITEPDAVMDLYQWRISHRRRVFREWSFLRLETGVDFSRERDYDVDPLVRLSLEIFLGHL